MLKIQFLVKNVVLEKSYKVDVFGNSLQEGKQNLQKIVHDVYRHLEVVGVLSIVKVEEKGFGLIEKVS